MDFADWNAYFRWPSRGEGWSPWAWLLLIPKLVLFAVVWVFVIALFLGAVFLPATAVFLLVDTVGLSEVLAVIAAIGAFVVTLYFAADLLDL